MTFTWKGVTYRRVDRPPEPPHIGRPAKPYEISIKGDFDSTSGELGIVKVSVFNATEFQVMYPPRGGAYNPRNDRRLYEPPSYYENGEKHYKHWCRMCAEEARDPAEGWQRRNQFYVDRSRGPGRERLQRLCKKHMKLYVERRRQVKREAESK